MSSKNLDLVCLVNKNSIGVGTPILVSEMPVKHIVLVASDIKKKDQIIVKCQGSFQESVPDFSAPKTEANAWDYIQMEDLNDRVVVDGDTGVVFEEVPDVRMYAVEIPGLRWLSLEVFSISKSSCTVSAKVHLFSAN